MELAELPSEEKEPVAIASKEVTAESSEPSASKNSGPVQSPAIRGKLPGPHGPDKPKPRAFSLIHVLLAVAMFVIIVLSIVFIWYATSGQNGAKQNDKPSQNAGAGGQTDPGDLLTDTQVTKARAALSDFVLSTTPELRSHFYFENASAQESQWRICSIVQQCANPPYTIASANLTSVSRGKFFFALSKLLHADVYHLLMLQMMSNVLLGEYQQWAEECDGTCRTLNTSIYQSMTEENFHTTYDNLTLDTFEKCADSNLGGTPHRQTAYWLCSKEPQLLLYGNVDTTTGNYTINNIFKENQIHARNSYADFMTVYGDLTGTGPFGFRFTGHHIDINYEFKADGTVVTLPVFIGHNPLSVLENTPEADLKEYYFMSDNQLNLWKSMAGVLLFPQVSAAILDFMSILTLDSYTPLDQFDSTPGNGGLTPKNGKTMAQLPHLDLDELSDAEFEQFWYLLKYTAPFLQANVLKKSFRTSGKLTWTAHDGPNAITGNPSALFADAHEMIRGKRTFLYLRAETDDHLYFLLLNKLFTLVETNEPSNHLHSVVIEKSYLNLPNGVTPDDPFNHVH